MRERSSYNIFACLFVLSFLFGQRPPDKKFPLYKVTIDKKGQFDGNRIRCDMENNGIIVSDYTGHSGLEWPKETNIYSVYASGIWFAGLVDGQIRTATAEYESEMVPGPWGSDFSDERHRFYKVNKSDMDNPAANPDFQNWPWDLGAPWVDVDGNGTYDPLPAGSDHPEFMGDQVVWYVANDGGTGSHGLMGTLPLGLEVQYTIYGFDRGDVIGDMMFVRALAINKGGNDINDMYVGLWSDPDLGDAGDDFVGCDTILSLGICYNDGLDTFYGDNTPAVGYDLFQGPVVPSIGDTAISQGKYIADYRNLPMTSFMKYIGPSAIFYDPNDAEEVYNYLSGLLADGTPFPLESTGGSRFVSPGDPTKNTGPDDAEYVDSDMHASGDRRFLMSSGPFEMAQGDTQEIVFGIFMAARGDPLDSYQYLKHVDKIAQYIYEHNLVFPDMTVPEVVATSYPEEIILTWNDQSEKFTVSGLATGYYRFEGYNVYQFDAPDGLGQVKKIATYDLINDVKKIFDGDFNKDAGRILYTLAQNGNDTGIKHEILITSDAFNQDSTLLTNREYYFAVTAYAYDPNGIPQTLESEKKVISVRPQISNTWSGNDSIVYGGTYEFDHTSGHSDGFMEATIVNPQAITGNDYEATIAKQHYYRDVEGVWKYTNSADAVTRIFSKTMDCSGSIITASAIFSDKVGTVDLTFTFDMLCGSNWVDGIVLDLPDDLTINSWDRIGDFSYGSVAGQNCDNMDGTLDATTNTITYGDDSRSEFGCIEGGQIWSVNVDPPSSYPLTVAYTVYDDAYDGTPVDIEGDAVVDELGYEFMTLQEWTVTDVTDNTVLFEHQTIEGEVSHPKVVDGILHPLSYAYGYGSNPVADGLMFALTGPPNDLKWIGVTHNAAGALDPIEIGAPYWWDWANWLPNDDWLGWGDDASGGQQSTADALWYINLYPGYVSAGQVDAGDWIANGFAYTGGNGSALQGIGSIVPDDVEIRFTGEGIGYDNWDGQGNFDIDFEVWNVGVPNDDSDDYRLIVWILDDDASGDFGLKLGEDHGTSGANNDPYTDRFYVMAPTDDTPGEQGHDNWYAGLAAGGAVASWVAQPGATDPGGPMDIWSFWHRTVFMLHNGGDVDAATSREDYDAVMPEIGTIWYLATTKPIATDDVFTFSTAPYVYDKVEYNVENIKVWPNPYFGFNPEERNPLDQQMHFTHLPETGKCKIRIFELAGNLVRIINHNDAGSQYAIWDLKNTLGEYVASGMYIAHIEYGDEETILKLAVIEPDR